MEWQKLTTSGSNAHLEALHLLGATSSTELVSNPEYTPNAQDLYLSTLPFGSIPYSEYNNTAWKAHPDNTNFEGDPWISEDRFVQQLNGNFYHKKFDISGAIDPDLNPTYIPTPGTGPIGGPGVSIPYPTEFTIPQFTTGKYIYAETSDPGEWRYSIVSPYIDLTDYTTKKLVFYFYMYGSNCGTTSVLYSPSNSSLENAQELLLSFWNGTAWSTNQLELKAGDDYGTMQGTSEEDWFRAEVDLTYSEVSAGGITISWPEVTQGYLWIKYISGDGQGDGQTYVSTEADFAIMNIKLELDGYVVPPLVPSEGNYETTLKAFSEVIKFHGLPTEDPEIEGALYKDIAFINEPKTYVLVSTGSAG